MRGQMFRLIALLATAALTLLPVPVSARDQSAAPEPPDATQTAPADLSGFEPCRHFFPGALPKVPHQQARLARGLCYDGFAILHSGQSRTPIFVVERLTRDTLADASHEKRHNRFFADARLPSRERATLEDYRDSGYDRGHMAPAADMPTARANDQSFSLANMVPQARINNERTWAGVEKATRHYVSHAKGPVFVFTGPVYQHDPPATIGPNRVWVPTHLFKLVYDPEAGRAWAFWVENTNEAHAGHPISYEDLVARTGLEFLPGVTPAR